MKISIRKSIIFVVICIQLAIVSCNKTTNPEVKRINEKENSLDEWKAMKFGLFIHWGVYSIPAGVWNGERVEKLGEQIMRHADISIPDYEALAKQFNPINFDADAIVKLAKNAGMKYVILTSKHHDGFAMFKSEATNYNIVDYTPYKRDVLKELAEACKSNGLKLGLYYSTPDWHFNGEQQERNPVDGKLSVFGKVSRENEDFQVAQLKELLSNYGEIVELFFDMGEPSVSQSKRFRKTVKELQPNCLINGRVMNDQGDFITMPDNHLPDVPIYNMAWETPGTFYHTWGYKSWVKGIELSKQIKKQIRNLSKITCMGGNYLLNIGPKSDGSVVPYEAEVLKGIGSWTKIHKEAIFDTEVNPFKGLKWGYSSMKSEENKLYLHVFNWPETGKLVLPGLQNKITKVYHLNDASKNELVFEELNDNKILHIGVSPSDENLSVVVVEYENVLEIVDPVISPDKNGNITLRDTDAIKHGKYGMKSYRSIIKDNYRTWDIDVTEDGIYEVQVIYKMKHDQKDFVLGEGTNILKFTLYGEVPGKSKVEELMDGNEEVSVNNKTSKIKYGKATVGNIQLNKGEQTIHFKSAKEFEFKTSLVEFHKQDRRNRGLNIDTELIRLVKK